MKVDSAVRKVLVRVPNWIGDAVLCTPALTSLRQKFPSAHITVLARQVIAELLRGHPGIDETLIYDQHGIHLSQDFLSFGRSPHFVGLLHCGSSFMGKTLDLGPQKIIS